MSEFDVNKTRHHFYKHSFAKDELGKDIFEIFKPHDEAEESLSDVSIDIVKKRINKSGKITSKTAQILAENLGHILKTHKKQLNLDKIVKIALNLKDYNSQNEPINMKPSERLKYYRLYSNGKYKDKKRTINRLSRDPKKYLKIIETIARELKINEDSLINKLVFGTRFLKEANDDESINFEPLRRLNELITKKSEKIINDYNIHDFVSKKRSSKIHMKWNIQKKSYDIKNVIDPYIYDNPIIFSVPIFEEFSPAITNCLYSRKEDNIDEIKRVSLFGNRVNFILLNQDGNIFPRIHVQPFIYLVGAKYGNLKLGNEYLFYDEINLETKSEAPLDIVQLYDEIDKIPLAKRFSSHQIDEYVRFHTETMLFPTINKQTSNIKKLIFSKDDFWKFDKFGNKLPNQNDISLSFIGEHLSLNLNVYTSRKPYIIDIYDSKWSDIIVNTSKFLCINRNGIFTSKLFEAKGSELLGELFDGGKNIISQLMTSFLTLATGIKNKRYESIIYKIIYENNFSQPSNKKILRFSYDKNLEKILIEINKGKKISNRNKFKIFIQNISEKDINESAKISKLLDSIYKKKESFFRKSFVNLNDLIIDDDYCDYFLKPKDRESSSPLFNPTFLPTSYSDFDRGVYDFLDVLEFDIEKQTSKLDESIVNKIKYLNNQFDKKFNRLRNEQK